MEGDAAHRELPDYFNVDAGMVTSTFFHIYIDIYIYVTYT